MSKIKSYGNAASDSLVSLFVGKWVPWLALVVVFYYQVHKYPLNFEAGAEASVAWRLGKYLVVLVLCLMAAALRGRKLFPLQTFDFLWLLTFGASALVGGLMRSTDLVECGFWALASWGIARMSLPLPMVWLKRWGLVALVLSLLMLSIQALGLVYFGKGFSSSNTNIWLSRFSGLTVEPLSAPMLGLFFVGFGFALEGWKRGVVLALGVFFVIACQTWTGYVYLLVLFALVSITYMRRHPKWILFAVALLALLAWLVLGSGKFNLTALYELKRPSIELHMTYWWPDVWRIWPSMTYDFNETWWVNGVENMGLVWTLAYHAALFYVLLVVWKKYRSYQTTECAWIYLATLIMGGYFLLGSLNLPYPVIYPANFLFFLFAMLCYFDRFNNAVAER